MPVGWNCTNSRSCEARVQSAARMGARSATREVHAIRGKARALARGLATRKWARAPGCVVRATAQTATRAQLRQRGAQATRPKLRKAEPIQEKTSEAACAAATARDPTRSERTQRASREQAANPARTQRASRLERQSGARDHGVAVAGARVCRRGRPPGAAVAARRNDRVLALEAMQAARRTQ
eukprot:6175742-Pleurochrysis_carterae.AAC.4